MLSINTNLPGLIAQRSLHNSTKLLNQAVERMSTGFKINHASDNAANYSISTNMGVKLSSYAVAEDNVAAGLDLLSTAGGSLDLISDKLNRLRALAEQAANGTYGAQSLKAINTEANAIVDEIERIYSTAEYNGIKLFGETHGSFIEEVKPLTESEAIDQGYTVIKTAEDLHKMDNSSDKFILMNDIDLSGYSTGEGWDPIKNFKGTFDGNGYVISNLYINRPDEDTQGLFGNTSGAEIKNIGIKNADISGNCDVGGLVGSNSQSVITNSYVTGTVSGDTSVGGLVGSNDTNSAITNSYATGSVSGMYSVGGLVGYNSNQSAITKSYVTGNVSGNSDIGGLVGSNDTNSTITNSYATGSVNGKYEVGGLVAYNYNSNIANSYATGSVNGKNEVGGLIAYNSDGNITNSYYNTDTTGQNDTGKGMGVTTSELNTLIKNGTLWKSELEATDAYKSQITTFQVGIHSGESSSISLDTGFGLNVSELRGIGLNNADYLSQIDTLLNTVSAKQTEYGAAENRLESCLEEISTQYENLVSSRSTLKDADIAKVSSTYIQQQILQQASATLLATANQSPALALQLL